MPIPVNLPKGCSSSRGASDIRHTSSQGGGLAKQTNRLYMLNVRRESLMNKRRTLEFRLNEIKDQLKEIETDIRATEKQYRKLQGNELHKRGENRNRSGAKVMAIKRGRSRSNFRKWSEERFKGECHERRKKEESHI